MANWKAQSIQLVWFIQSQSLSASELFKQLFQTEPDASQSITAPALPRQSQASAVADGVNRQVIVQPGRVDLISVPIDVAPQARLRMIEEVGKETQKLVQAAAAATALQKSSRLALVTNLVEEKASPEEATGHLNALLGNIITDPKASDLVFQVNSPKSIRALKAINRLLRWNVITLQTLNMQAVPPQGTAPLPFTELSYYSGLTLDLNTVPSDTKTLTARTYVKTWEALAVETMRLRQTGRLAELMQ